MGIKDKVLDILFDDDEQEVNYNTKSDSNKKKNYEASSFLDTGSIFIDATSPLPKTNKNRKQTVEEITPPENNHASEYQFTENISPIFGIIDSKNKKSKFVSKLKGFSDINIKKTDSTNKNQNTGYTSVVISPIFGPISTKPLKKSSKPRKKADDPFERDITDTGNFDAIIDENDAEQSAPDFEEAVEETTEPITTGGDTDRLIRISDRINKIKNEAANIYVEEESDDDSIVEDGYQVETIEHKSVSDLIHSVKDYDGKIEHTTYAQEEEPVLAQTNNDDSFEYSEDEENDSEVKHETNIDIPNSDLSGQEEVVEREDNNVESTINENNNPQTSIDDIFQDEDDIEEGKDLFSVLFGDD